MKLSGVCPDCEQQVEFSAELSGAGRFYKCNNCWHTLDEEEFERAKHLAGQLAFHEEERQKILKGLPPSKKPGGK